MIHDVIDYIYVSLYNLWWCAPVHEYCQLCRSEPCVSTGDPSSILSESHVHTLQVHTCTLGVLYTCILARYCTADLAKVKRLYCWRILLTGSLGLGLLYHTLEKIEPEQRGMIKQRCWQLNFSNNVSQYMDTVMIYTENCSQEYQRERVSHWNQHLIDGELSYLSPGLLLCMFCSY